MAGFWVFDSRCRCRLPSACSGSRRTVILVLGKERRDDQEKEATQRTLEWRRAKVFGRAYLLSDVHAGDDDAVHTEEEVQDVTQTRVVQHHGPWAG